MSDIKHDVATLLYAGAAGGLIRARVRIEGEWTIRTGIKPDVNRAIIDYRQFDTVAEFLGKEGTLELWYQKAPETEGAVPDVSLAGVRVVDVQPREWGQVLGEAGHRIVAYTLYLADWREGLSTPFGGHLSMGVVNADQQTTAEPPPVKLYPELIEACLRAMDVRGAGGSGPAIPAGIDNLQPPMNLQWVSSHAPTELAKLLVGCQAVFCPDFTHTAGDRPRARVELVGEGAEPTIPASDLLPELTVPFIGRRGNTVIITSEPTPVRETVTLAGPSPETWEFVGQNKAGAWVPLAEAIAESLAPESNLVGPGGTLTIDALALNYIYSQGDLQESRRQAVLAQVYRCVRLNTLQFDPVNRPILRRVLGATSAGRVSISSMRAYRDPSGLWRLPLEPIVDTAEAVIDGTVVRFPEMILGIQAESPVCESPWLAARILEPNSCRLTFTADAVVSAGEGELKPEYLVRAFRLVDGEVEALDEGETANLLASPDGRTQVWRAPELAVLRVIGDDGTEYDNGPEKVAAAKAIAERLLAGSEDVYRIRSARGFVPAALSGVVGEIRYDQANLRTTFVLNNWYLPLGGLPQLRQENTRGEAYGQQAALQATRTAIGAVGAGQPGEVASRPEAPPLGVFPVLVVKDGGDEGTKTTSCTFTYTVKSLAGETIKTGVQLSRPRPLGKMVAQVGTEEFPAYGLAFWRRGELKLWDAGEVYDTGVC